MKIGIVTIIGNNNYGNRLQNYALQYFFKKNNIESVTLLNEEFSNTKKNYIFRKIKNLKKNNNYSTNYKRRENFEKFNKYINFSEKKITAFSKDSNKLDFYLVGSDQVWNPYHGRLRDVDLLRFVKPSKRISVSASFGINNIPKKMTKKVAKELKKFNSLSVREDKGKEIIENLTGRNDIEVLIDPTMLLTGIEWDQVSQKPEHLNSNRYILNYFLGDLSNDRKIEIEKFAKNNNCKIINILDENDPFYSCGPSEFLYLEKNAYLICTDSFHSSVFAILFKRPFIIFEREQKNSENMFSRINTLLSKFDLINRKYNGKITKENLNIDYSNTCEILNTERIKFEKFIKKSLNVKD